MRQEDLERLCAAYGRSMRLTIESDLGKGIGFAMILFDFGPSGSLAYAANAERADMIKTLQELIEHLRTRDT